MIYEVLFFDGWGTMPAYYLLDGVEGDTPEQALSENLKRITQRVRRQFDLDEDEVSDEKIQGTIYVLRENGLVSVRDVAGLRRG
ncbi:MAG: hypothetical protein H5T64_05085 [Chloroflexi bacterium]|nr:hypothetical protein [Chloroflexota bacterium]